MPSVMRELRRRVSAEQSLPSFDPCLPRPALVPPAGPGWIHEIKHDGFRILAHRRGRSVQLLTRNGNDFADRFPLIVEAIEALPVKSCVVDGEAIVCDGDGLAVFDLIRGHGRNGQAVLCTFDLIEVNGEDLRREMIEDRKRRLAGLLRLSHDGIAANEDSPARARQSIGTHARSAARASCRSAWVRPIGPAARRIGSR
jgi:bifunctional non-homologous end joining protein LigD